MFKGQTILLSPVCSLAPSLDQYQTWCRGCPQWVNDPYWFSGHMFKGHGQTTLLSQVCCLLNIFWPLHLMNTKLGAGAALNENMIPIDFQVTCSKVKVKPLFSAQYVVRSISFDPFTWSILNLVQGLLSMSRWTLLILKHMFKGQGQTTLLRPLCCPVNIFFEPFHLISTKLGARVVPNK